MYKRQEEVIAGIRVVKSFVQTKREEERFVAQVQSAMELSLRRATIMAWFVPTIIFVTFAAAALVLWYGGRHVIHGTVSPRGLFSFVAVFYTHLRDPATVLDLLFPLLL